MTEKAEPTALKVEPRERVSGSVAKKISVKVSLDDLRAHLSIWLARTQFLRGMAHPPTSRSACATKEIRLVRRLATRSKRRRFVRVPREYEREPIAGGDELRLVDERP